MKPALLICALLMLANRLHAEDFTTLAHACAPQIAQATLQSIVQVESNFNPYAVNINSKFKLPVPTRSLGAALRLVRKLDAEKANYDVGLMQVNSSNIARFSITPEDLLDPCTNLRIGSRVLQDCFETYRHQYESQQEAILVALSCYNSGSSKKGFENGYVNKIVSASRKFGSVSGQIVPEIVTDFPDSSRHKPMDNDAGVSDIFGVNGQGISDAFSSVSYVRG